MFAIFGLGETELIIIAILCLAIVWPAWRVCAKAGFPGALGIMVVVPGAFLLLFFILAFADWPALRKSSPTIK